MKTIKRTIETETYEEIHNRDEMIYFLNNSYIIYEKLNTLDNVNTDVTITAYNEKGFERTSNEHDCLYSWFSETIIPYEKMDYSKWVAIISKIDIETEYIG